MANAQNGWPVIPNTDAGRRKLAELILPGLMTHAVRVLAGDVHTIATWHVGQYQRRVEAIEPRGCWGWNVRKIGKSDDWSNHAAACAWDLNAPNNPDGVPTHKVMTPKQIEQCHALERESGGVLRWGGDWSDPDAMHWEIVGTRAQTKAFAQKIRKQQEESTVTPTPPTSGQNADAVWDEPIALPDGRTVSARTILAWRDEAEKGTRALVTEESGQIDKALAAISADPAAMENPDDHPIVKAMRYAMTVPARTT